MSFSSLLCMYNVSIELFSQYHREDVIAEVEVQAVTVTAGRVAGRLPVRGIGPHVQRCMRLRDALRSSAGKSHAHLLFQSMDLLCNAKSVSSVLCLSHLTDERGKPTYRYWWGFSALLLTNPIMSMEHNVLKNFKFQRTCAHHPLLSYYSIRLDQ